MLFLLGWLGIVLQITLLFLLFIWGYGGIVDYAFSYYMVLRHCGNLCISMAGFAVDMHKRLILCKICCVVQCNG